MRKEAVRVVVDSFPDDVDVDELLEKLYVLDRIERGEQEIEAGHGITQEDAEKRLEKWLK